MKNEHIDTCYFGNEHGQIIHRITDDLYRVIVAKFNADVDEDQRSNASITYTTKIIADLYLRQKGDQIEIDSIVQATDEQAIQNIIEQFRKKMNAFTNLQQLIKQIQQTNYKVKISRLTKFDILDPTFKNIYHVSVYTNERKVALGTIEISNRDTTLTLYKGELSNEEFAVILIEILEQIRQNLVKEQYDFEITTKLNEVKPTTFQKGDAVFEYCYSNVEKLVFLMKNIKSIDFDYGSAEFQIVGERYAIITIECDRYRISLFDIHKPVDSNILVSYIL